MEAGKPTPDQIFEHALQFTDPHKRSAYIKEAVGGDEQLRLRVEALLQAHDNAGDFLAKNPIGVSARTLLVSSSAMEVVTEKSGDRIGRYKLLQQIGEGGCGVVYMAEQEEPVRRRVALKVIKLGMDTKQVVGRFEAERQALALMDHPNIAKVLDAGATETGRPYFVMELVRGIKITDYCDQNNLSTEERLNLFIQVCHAIQHAHQKGIIHRDIKPSNVLVTLHNGVPVPKVIDFGIAKATTDQRLTDKTVFTAFEQFIGTPAYMSPEQAEMSGLDIDTRSDVYSLGVLLYELLTGRTPFDPNALLKAGLDQMRKLIREQEPPRPSIRLRTLEYADLTFVAQHREAEPPKLISLLRGDLDWIVMKSLEKDRTCRYETANGLARDIERHLANQPVLARPPTKFYQFQRLVRRNKVGFTASAAVLAALLVGFGVSTTMFFKEREASERAKLAEKGEAKLRESAEWTAAELLTTRADGYAGQGKWRLAAQDLKRAVKLNPTNFWDWFRLAPLLVVIGDSNGYQLHCREMLVRFTNKTDFATNADRLAKACLLEPRSETGFNAAAALAQKAVELGEPDYFRPYFHVTKALAAYRQGNWSIAEESATRGLTGEDPDPNIHALAYTLIAMSSFRLGRIKEAQTNLAMAVEIQLERPTVHVENGPLLSNNWEADYWQQWWHDWLITEIVLHEARLLIEGESKSGVP